MKTLHFSLAIAIGVTANAYGQDFSRQSSEVERFKSIIRRETTASGIARQSTQINTGFGLKPITAPLQGVTGSSGPPRSQSASFSPSTAGSTVKPFANVTAAPTISPYLGLFNEGFGEFNDLDYQTIVRPQIQQQQFNQQIQRQTQAINRRVNALAARNPYNTTGNQSMMPTGHAATFQYYSRFYPRAGGRRR